MIALLANKTAAKALAIFVLLLTLMAGAWWIHGRIYDDGYQAATLVKNAEIATILRDAAQADADEQRRQTIANNAAKKREAEAIAQLEAEQAANTELRRKLASEARQGPDADKPSLGAGSVQRINQVR
ncbi:hypothetical protein SAMN03159496_04617 [Rhizobium sp. NFR07]|uniref:hypothetical protein n=1 Tax=Rhizobium sp. NFR07 TaxID=1566262 RepID=UPI0008F0BE82|nr:hypothetical protein [Rhizobium sp. NFR07]SFB52198.1 hypothetical protein SAMN03159496_04617 [Rhizobium sp. NFR07]